MYPEFYSLSILKIILRIEPITFGLLTTTTFILTPPVYFETIIPRIINAAARTKSINLVGKQSESNSPAPKAANEIPRHLAFEHISVTPPALISIHYMPKSLCVLKLPFFKVFYFIENRNIACVA